jgi:hypothetical protein
MRHRTARPLILCASGPALGQDSAARGDHALREQLGLDGVLAEMNCGSLIAHQRVMRSLQLLCDKVMAQFR